MTKYYFDKDAGKRAIDFIEKFCTHTKGELAGKPFLLEEWQKEIVRNIFGWKIEGSGLRKYRTVFIEIPRKNGKTTLAAAISLYMLFADSERGAEIYAAAGDRSQAGIVFEIAKGMILNSNDLSSRSKVFRDSVTNEGKGNFFKAISSDSKTKHGFNANGIIFDELHTQPNRDLYDTLTTSTGSRREPLTVVITTAGYDKQSICYEVYKYAKQVLAGSIIDETFYSVIYEADEEDDVTLESTWIKANPNYGVSLQKDYMAQEAKKAITIPSYLNTFKRLQLNIWTDSQTQWIGHNEWMECHTDFDYSTLEGKICHGGLDLASTRDISAFVLVFEVDKKFVFLPFLFIPEVNAKKRSDRDGVDYMTWIKSGHVIATPGDVADYNFIKAKINELSLKYKIQAIAYDRWNASMLVTDLMNDGANMKPFGQGFVSMSAPTKELEKLILSKEIIHDGNPAMNWMLGNVAVLEDPAGNIKVAKNKSKDKVDGIVSMVMALGEFMDSDDEESIYESMGIRTL